MSAILTPPIPVAPPAPTQAGAPAHGYPPLYRLSVAQYEAILRHGIIEENNRIELVRGLLVAKEMKNTLHVVALGMLADILARLIPLVWHLRNQDPLSLADSMPEPDLAVVRGRRQDWLPRHPGPVDTGLVVEVSDSTLAYDRGEKKALYAEARIPTYWIVNLVDRVLEVRTGPRGSGETADYADVRVLGPSDSVVLTLDGVALPAIQVRDLLP